MRGIAFYLPAFFLLLFTVQLRAQKVGTYTITADTVLMTSCDSTELTLRNHTDTVPGFLFNTGGGHTVFKRGLQYITGGSVVVGGDTLKPWLQGGNKFGTTGILGTMDNNPLDLYANGAQQIRLASNGRTLFGSTSDNGLNKFQFTGTIFDTVGYYTNFSSNFSGPNNNYGAIRLRWGSAGDGTYISFYNQGNLNRRGYIGSPSDARPLVIEDLVGVAYSNIPFVDVGAEVNLNSKLNVVQLMGTENGLSIARVDTTHQLDTIAYDFVVNAVGHTMLANQPISGNVTDNGSTLQVYGSTYVSGAVRLSGLTQDSTKTRVLVSDASGNLYYRSAASLAANDPIRSSLAVNGTIRSKKLIISPDGWADYVFDSTYRLPQLSEVESYIRKEHHLPGIPSAASVQKDSLDVGASQAALLKKIEELTLYTIDQNKKLDDQQKQIDQLKAELEMLIDKQSSNKHQ